MNLIRKGISVLLAEGPVSFAVSVGRYFASKVRDVKSRLYPWYFRMYLRFALVRGKFTLSTRETSVAFVAESKESITGTRMRFQSEKKLLDEIMDELESTDVFYDVGANVGLYTCFGATKCLKVVAFEPYPPNISELEHNAALNGQDVTILDVALSDETGEIGFITEANEKTEYPDAGSAGFGRGTITEETADLMVQTVRGDELIAEGVVPPPNVVKIDVEGAEPLVIDGLANALSDERCRAVYCEVHRPGEPRGSIQDFGVEEEEDLITRFEKLGFEQVSIEDSGGTDFLIKAKREK